MSHVMTKPVLPYATNKGTDQPARPRRLVSAFIIRCQDSITLILAKSKKFKTLASFCGCAGRVEPTLVAKPEDRFSRDEAHILRVRIPKALVTLFRYVGALM